MPVIYECYTHVYKYMGKLHVKIRASCIAYNSRNNSNNRQVTCMFHIHVSSMMYVNMLSILSVFILNLSTFKHADPILPTCRFMYM